MRSASIPRIVWNDYYCVFIWGTSLLFSAGAVIFLYIIGVRDFSFLVKKGILLLLVIPVSLLWMRASGIKQIIENGTLVTGTIANVTGYQLAGRIYYDYEFEGERYQGVDQVVLHRQARSLIEGGSAQIVVNPDFPKEAYVYDLYTNSE